MFNHIMVGTNDIERSKAFYNTLLGTVFGAAPPHADTAASGHKRLFYRHEGSTFAVTQPINNEPAAPANGATVAFKCASPEQVQAFHDVAVMNGATSIEDPPGLRVGTLGSHHLAYVLDPDGNKLCAIYRMR